MKSLLLLFFLITFSAYSQRDLLNSNLSEYGTKMTYTEVWTDDNYIILALEGTINKKKGHVFLVVHPNQGIIASYIVEREALHPYSSIIFTNDEELTVFYRLLIKGKRVNYSLSFSKISKQIHVKEIGEEIEKIEKESVFSFLSEDRLLFASVSKEKDKVAFRQMTNRGEAIVTNVFTLSDSLWKFINPKKSSSSKKVLERTGYVFGNSVRVMGSEYRNKEFTTTVFDFNLETEKMATHSFTQPNTNNYKSFRPSFGGDNVFILKLAASSPSQPTAYQMDLEILEYPTFKQLQSFSTSLSNLLIPYKTSRVSQVSFKSGLYFSGRNRKFSEPVQENISTINLLSKLSRGEPFLLARQGTDNNTHLTIGSREDLLVTNTVITTTTYFFGCLDNNLKPCVGNQKSPSEKIIEYLSTIRDEKPDYLEFGDKRTFGVFNLYGKDEIVLMEF